jgi:hypothetical protein
MKYRVRFFCLSKLTTEEFTAATVALFYLHAPANFSADSASGRPVWGMRKRQAL